MKLAAGNPNLMRVNPNADLGSFANTTGDKAHAKQRTGFVPSVKDPNAALAPSISVWKQPVYVPENHQPARRGADDFLHVQSRGF
jgi:hypothetical protein